MKQEQSSRPTLAIIHNTELNRFETRIEVDGTNHLGYISYKVDNDTLIYDHTIVPKILGGKGVGSGLVKHALNYAKEHHKKVIPACSFVEHYIEKHPEYQPLLVS